jgi:hypothetical protein
MANSFALKDRVQIVTDDALNGMLGTVTYVPSEHVSTYSVLLDEDEDQMPVPFKPSQLAPAVA